MFFLNKEVLQASPYSASSLMTSYLNNTRGVTQKRVTDFTQEVEQVSEDSAEDGEDCGNQ